MRDPSSPSKPVRVAVACQGGGAHTAFTAGVLDVLVPRQQEDGFNIVALSGTSGGAVCAALAWCSLVLGEPRTQLKEFWTAGYPDGNAAPDYLEAFVAELNDFVAAGRLPWLRVMDRWRVDAGLSLLEDPSPGQVLPVHLVPALRTYYFHALFDTLSRLTPAPVQTAVESLRRLPAMLRPAMAPLPWGLQWCQLLEDCADLLPLSDGTLRRESDAQDSFRALLQRYFPDERLQRVAAAFQGRPRGALPELLVGAVDVQRTHFDVGERGWPWTAEDDRLAAAGFRPDCATNFKTFRGSAVAPDLVDHLLASAAVPTVMRAVRLDGDAHWDGLYASNPPIFGLPDVHGDAALPGSDEAKRDGPPNPEEIWIVRINPMQRKDEPTRYRDIEDRRNELAANVSLVEEMRAIRAMNGLVGWDPVKQAPCYYAPVSFGAIDISPKLAGTLDYISKLDRRAEFLIRLYEDGRTQAHAFLARWRQNEGFLKNERAEHAAQAALARVATTESSIRAAGSSANDTGAAAGTAPAGSGL